MSSDGLVEEECADSQIVSGCSMNGLLIVEVTLKDRLVNLHVRARKSCYKLSLHICPL